jgi:hypothetical protein
MQLIASRLLEPILGLSGPACVAGLAIGVLLWLLGWWAHRFWIVLFATVTAGVLGLSPLARVAGATPIVAGILLAISAGMMALALARITAFVAGGAAVCIALQLLFPAWDERVLAFLVGGLAGLVMFRFWMMLLSSLGGTLMITYAGLSLLHRLGKLDAPSWIEQRSFMLNWGCVALTMGGLLAQYLLERMRKKMKKRREEEAQLQRAELELEKRMQRRPWWKWGEQRRAA